MIYLPFVCFYVPPIFQSKDKGKGVPLYRRWDFVQVVRPIGGVQV